MHRTEPTKLSSIACFNLEEMINCCIQARLVAPDPQKPVPEPPLLLGGVHGSIYAIQGIERKEYEYLAAIEQAVSEQFSAPGRLNHQQWRHATHCIDGDMVERLLELGPEQAAAVALAVKTPLADLIKHVEELARSIH